jgi:hypothetical protein
MIEAKGCLQKSHRHGQCRWHLWVSFHCINDALNGYLLMRADTFNPNAVMVKRQQCCKQSSN